MFKCPKCGKTFSTKKVLDIHVHKLCRVSKINQLKNSRCGIAGHKGDGILTFQINKAINGNVEAKEYVLNHYAPRIQDIVNHHIAQAGSLDREDLEQTANLALLELLDLCKKNNKDSTYFTRLAFVYTVNQVGKLVCDNNRNIRIPYRLYHPENHYDLDLYQHLPEILRNTETVPIEWCTIVHDFDVGHFEYGDIFNMVKQACSPREYELIYHRYKNDYTLEQTGQILGISGERVRQLEKRALRKTKQFMTTLTIIPNRPSKTKITRQILFRDIKCDLNKREYLNITIKDLQDNSIEAFKKNKNYTYLLLRSIPKYEMNEDTENIGYRLTKDKYQVFICGKDHKEIILNKFIFEADALRYLLTVLEENK